MIVVLSPGNEPLLTEVDTLDRLHAESPGAPGGMATGPLCHVDGDHVWLDIAVARAAGSAATSDPGWVDAFDAMIAYATSSGWVDESGSSVRAHVVRTDT